MLCSAFRNDCSSFLASLVTILNFDYYNITVWIYLGNPPIDRCGFMAMVLKKLTCHIVVVRVSIIRTDNVAINI